MVLEVSIRNKLKKLVDEAGVWKLAYLDNTSNSGAGARHFACPTFATVDDADPSSISDRAPQDLRYVTTHGHYKVKQRVIFFPTIMWLVLISSNASSPLVSLLVLPRVFEPKHDGEIVTSTVKHPKPANGSKDFAC